eukprot:2573580-Rhodomonas_salina.1
MATQERYVTCYQASLPGLVLILLLATRYAKPGTDLAYGARTPRQRKRSNPMLAAYAMCGTDTAYGTLRIDLRTCYSVSGTGLCYAMSGTHVAHGAGCAVLTLAYGAPCYALCGTDIAFAIRDV